MLNLTVVVDNDEAIRKFRELQKVAKTTTSNVVSDSDRMDMAMRKLATALGSLGVGFSLTEFARKVAMVRGEFQQLEVAFTTMLGNKEKADALMAKTVDFAAKTPFDLQGVAAGTKQLLAYGSNAEEVTDELRMLGDIAAGLSMPLGDLVYLYGTTRTQGRMFTMDLRQFMGRGIPLAEELAKKFGVTKAEVGKLVTEGKVGFNDMKDALVAMTSEGGKFYNLMEEQSKTITGKMSNLGDAVDQMFNNIGKQSEGIISGAIDSAAYLVENYEKIGKVLMDIIVAYGSYKAAVMTVNALNKARAIYLAAEVAATKLSAAANKQLTASNILLAKSLKALNVAKYLTNPYVLAGAAIGALIFGTYKLITAKSLEEKAQEKVNKQMEEYNQKAEEEKQKASENISKMNDANISTFERVKAYNDLVAAYPELLDKYDKEKIKLMEIAELEKEISGIASRRVYESAKANRAVLQEELDVLANTKQKNFQNGKWVTYTLEDSRKGKKIQAEIRAYDKVINEYETAQEQAKFDALPKAEKVKRLASEIGKLNAKVAEYNEQIDKSPNYTPDSDTVTLRDNLLAQIAEKEKEKSTLEDAIEKEKAEQGGGGTDETEEQDAIREANKAEQDAIREGITDKIKLLEFEKEAELAEIQSRIDATTDKETKAALQRKYNAVEMRYDTRIGAEQTQRDKDAEEAQKQHLNSLLEQYATYEMKRKALIEKAEQDIIDLQSVNINGENDAVIENVKAQLNEDIKQLNEQTFVDTDDFQSFVDSLVGKAVNELETIKKGLKEILANTTDPKQRGLLETQINAIDKLSKERKAEPPTKKEKWTTMLSAINDVGSSARDALDNIEGMDDGLKDMLSTSLELANGVGNLVFAIIGVGEAAKGIERASAILAAISAAIQVASMLFKVFTGESSEDKTLKAFKELNSEIRRLKDESKLENWEDTIFGSDGFGRAIHAMGVYMEKLKEVGFGERDKGYTLSESLQAMLVKTRHSTWFRPRAKYSSLKELLPELFGEDGEVNMDALKEFVDSDLFNKLHKRYQDFIKELVHDWELYEEALDGVKDYLSGIFGDLSNNLMDAMTNAFVSGTDAAEEFGDALSGVLEKFAQDMVYNLLFADMFKKAQDDMLAVMGDESLSSQDKFSKISDLFGGLLNGVEAQSNNAMDLYKELQRRAEEEGIDLFGKDTESQQDATSKGFQAMSQDTGDELNGRFTDIQGKVTEIRDYILQMMASGQMRLGEMINIRDIAIQLNGNVEQIKTYSMVLPEMNDTLASMNKKLDNL